MLTRRTLVALAWLLLLAVAAVAQEVATVGSLPSAAVNRKTYLVTDSLTPGDCTTGGGILRSLCISDGTVWQAVESRYTAATLPTDASHRFVTDAEISAWNASALPSLAGNSLKVLRVNAGETATEWAVSAGGGDMLKSENLSGLVNYTTARSNLGLGTLATQSGTFSGNSSGTNTGDQTNISGNAATVTTNANLSGDVTSAGNVTTVGASKITNAMLAGAIDVTTKITGVVPFANGGRAGSAATSATTGTMTVSMATAIVTITPTGACTFNASGGLVGQLVTFAVTTSGTTSFTLTWGTNFTKVGTLATGTTSARKFSVTFVCIDGTIWQEIARTAAMA